MRLLSLLGLLLLSPSIAIAQSYPATKFGGVTVAPEPGGNSSITASTERGGSGNLFITGPSSNQISFFHGGVNSLSLTSAGVFPKMPLTFNTSGYNPLTTCIICELLSSVSGTHSGPVTMNNLGTTADTAALGVNDNMVVLNLVDEFGGGSTGGQRNTLFVTTGLTAATANTTYGTPFAAAQLQAFTTASDNGTVGAPKGAIWAINTVSKAGCVLSTDPTQCATNWAQVDGYEMDMVAVAGSTVSYKQGLVVSLSANDGAQGLISDSGIIVAVGGGYPTSLGWRHPIEIGSYGGHWGGCNSVGCSIIYGEDHLGTGFTQYDGIDWHLGTFTHNIMNMGGVFIVSGSGAVTAQSYTAGASAGVSCSAGTVSLSTMVVTNGIVTHC